MKDDQPIEHGTYKGYNLGKCRCTECRRANTERYHERRTNDGIIKKKNMPRWFTEEERTSWPEEHKTCRGCYKVLPFNMFTKNKSGLFGLDTKCKDCRHIISVKAWAVKKREVIIFNTAKSRATKKGIEFTLSHEDIVIPEFCPVLGIKLISGGQTWSSPSIDRIDSKKGYVKGNICIMSTRANTLKNNATIEELKSVLDWMKENH